MDEDGYIKINGRKKDTLYVEVHQQSRSKIFLLQHLAYNDACVVVIR